MKDIFKNWKGSIKKLDLKLISVSSGPTQDIQGIILGTNKRNRRFQEPIPTKRNQGNNVMQGQNNKQHCKHNLGRSIMKTKPTSTTPASSTQLSNRLPLSSEDPIIYHKGKKTG